MTSYYTCNVSRCLSLTGEDEDGEKKKYTGTCNSLVITSLRSVFEEP